MQKEKSQMDQMLNVLKQIIIKLLLKKSSEIEGHVEKIHFVKKECVFLQHTV